jgi:hypothetical protein
MIKSAKAESIPVAAERESSHPGWWAALAVLLAAWIGIPMVLPLVAALPWILFNRRREHRPPSAAPTIRWATAVWCTMAAMSALAGERAARAVPLGVEAAASARAWLDGTSGAAPSWIVMAAWFVLMVATAIPMRGFIASIVLAHALLVTAIHASVTLANSANLLHASIVAMPVWTALLLIGMILLIDPLATGGIPGVRDAHAPGRKRLMTAAALIALAFLTRFALAGVMTSLARRVVLS